MAQTFVSVVAHFFVVVGGSKFHDRLAHFFIDIYMNEKKAAYAELKKVRDELRDLAVHTANYEELRELEEREKRKETEHGRD